MLPDVVNPAYRPRRGPKTSIVSPYASLGTAKTRDNAVKQDRVRATNAIRHCPEESGFLHRTELIGGTGQSLGRVP